MIHLEQILSSVQTYLPNSELRHLCRAYAFCCRAYQDHPQKYKHLQHHLEVASILTRLKMDTDSIVAALIHEVMEDGLVSRLEVADSFGGEVATLVEGIGKIGKLSFRPGEERQAESFRKMLLSMARDIRIILIKIAERTLEMRELADADEEHIFQIATETRAVYAPLANRMGISWLKSELEDLSFQYLEKDEYIKLSERIAKKRDEREEYVATVKKSLLKLLVKLKVESDVDGRFKHLYSVYDKMQRQEVELEEIYDLIAFRVIVPTIKDCYAVLGGVHSTWKPISGRFKDYIAMPKVNGYQSLHTTVFGPGRERIEIQIRTEEMHRIAEEGIAAHWRYKEGNKSSVTSSEEKNFNWLRQLLEWQRELHDSDDLGEITRVDLFPEQVYVFTPTGDVHELPKGACTIDFAFAIHSEVGNHCVGSKINGRMVPLKTEVKNGDIVEIQTSKSQRPNKDWLKFVKTSKAKNKIRHWVKLEQQDKSIELGKEMLEKELRKYGRSLNKFLGGDKMQIAVNEAGLKGEDDLLAAIGYGKVSFRLVVSTLLPKEDITSGKSKKSTIAKVLSKIRKKTGTGIQIQGFDDILIRFANCCRPLPGDPIVGFITKGKGVTVHAVNCHVLVDAEEDRKIDVEWDGSKKAKRPAKIKVYCVDQKGILVEITGAISNCDADIISAKIQATTNLTGVNTFEVDVRDNEHLTQVVNALNMVKGVLQVERIK